MLCNHLSSNECRRRAGCGALDVVGTEMLAILTGLVAWGPVIGGQREMVRVMHSISER